MTAIAYRDGIMAADTMCILDDHVKLLNDIKVTSIKGHLIGISGTDCPTNEDFIKRFFSPAKLTPWAAPRSFTTLVVTPEGSIELWDETGTKTSLNEEFWAVGSGKEYAIGAMEAGATARQAVTIAIKRCPTVSGKVVWRQLKGTRSAAKARS